MSKYNRVLKLQAAKLASENSFQHEKRSHNQGFKLNVSTTMRTNIGLWDTPVLILIYPRQVFFFNSANFMMTVEHPNECLVDKPDQEVVSYEVR